MASLPTTLRRIGGTGTTGETVIIYNNGVEVARVEVVNNEWSYTLPTQTDGPLNITVAAVDEAGNVSPISPVFTVEVDTGRQPCRKLTPSLTVN